MPSSSNLSQRQKTRSVQNTHWQSRLVSFVHRHLLIISLCLLTATVTSEIMLPALASNTGTTQIVGKADASKQLKASRQLLAPKNASISAPLDAAATCPSVTLASLPGPDGQTSLREAVCAANSNAGADTITFSVNGTFALTGSANEDNGSAGDVWQFRAMA